MSTAQAPIQIIGISQSAYGQTQVELYQEFARGTAPTAGKHGTRNSFSGLGAAEQRRVWVTVPEGTTEEQFQSHLDSYPNACIYKVLSLSPILTAGQEKRIATGELTLDQVAERQAVQDGKGNYPLYEERTIQYRAVFFDEEGREDEDERAFSEEYVPASLAHLLEEEVEEVAAPAPVAPAKQAKPAVVLAGNKRAAVTK